MHNKISDYPLIIYHKILTIVCSYEVIRYIVSYKLPSFKYRKCSIEDAKI
jgi:hypothetical protein